MSPSEIIVDLFAGGGGASYGIQLATGRGPDIAVNHDPAAIRMHEANHPAARHYCESVFSVDPVVASAGRPIGLLWLSPDCRHFSRAKGSAPVSKSIRSLAWIGLRWAKQVRPRVVILENVPELATWGPVIGPEGCQRPDPKRSGELFDAFLQQWRRHGYEVEHRTLNAADFGAPTSRKRLFLVARCDGQPITWPEPTHGPGRANPWRTAAECIDWSLACPSIFERKRPLAEATCRRIATGIVRYVLNGSPFIVTCNHAGAGFRGQGLDQPMRTITASRDAHGLVSAFITKFRRGAVGSDLRAPAPTITAGAGSKRPAGAAHAMGLVAAHLVGIDHRQAGDGAAWSVEHPLGTVTTEARHGLVAAFLTKYYGEGSTSQGLAEPMHTIVQKARFGLVTVRVDGADYTLADIGLRMLQPHELARAQGFPSSYQLTGTKSQQVARIGNSVVPQVAAAVVSANCGTTSQQDAG